MRRACGGSRISSPHALEKFGRREHLTVELAALSAGRPADPEAEARTPVRSEDLLYRTDRGDSLARRWIVPAEPIVLEDHRARGM